MYNHIAYEDEKYIQKKNHYIYKTNINDFLNIVKIMEIIFWKDKMCALDKELNI